MGTRADDYAYAFDEGRVWASCSRSAEVERLQKLVEIHSRMFDRAELRTVKAENERDTLQARVTLLEAALRTALGWWDTYDSEFTAEERRAFQAAESLLEKEEPS